MGDGAVGGAGGLGDEGGVVAFRGTMAALQGVMAVFWGVVIPGDGE